MTALPSSESKPRRMGWMAWVMIVFVLQVGVLLWVSRESTRRDQSESSAGLKTGMDAKALESMAQADPELLAQPNPKGFSGVWLRDTPPTHEPHRWTAPDIELPYPSNLMTRPLEAALASNAPPRAVAFVKPLPRLSKVEVPPLELRNGSRMEVAGNLKTRPLAQPVPLGKVWKHAVPLKPSVVQVMVDARGRVTTGALIGASGLDAADELALAVALLKVRFQAVTNAPLATGDLLFHWHVDPASVTNLTVSPR